MQIHELPSYSGEPSTDDVFPLDTGTHTFKLPFADLGEAIITTVSATISGVSQTVKAAIEALAGRVSTLESKTTPTSVSLTATKGSNCSYVTINQAYVSAGVLYIKFTVRPDSGLTSSTANVDFTISGLTPAIKPDWRIGFGIIGATLYGAWIADQNGTIRCRRMDGNVWSSDTTSVIFSGVIPLA